MDKTHSAAILTRDRYLYQKLYLELKEKGYSVTEEKKADVLICDLDFFESRAGAVSLSRRKDAGADLTLPLRRGELSEFLSKISADGISVIPEAKTVKLGARSIKLTEIEFSLFSLLFERRDYVSRNEILDTVWGDGVDGGVINVYIHYLREKLESGGEKIILSSRKLGYRISEKYLRGENE